MYEELLDLYRKLEPLNIVAPPAHTIITPKIGVLLGLHGNLMGAMYINETAIVPCTEQSECRTSNIAPHLIHDNLSYVGNMPGYEQRFSAYMSQLHDYINHVEDSLAKAVYKHLNDGNGLLMAELKPLLDCIPVPAERISVVFGIPGMKTTINHDWTKYYVNSLPINGMCSITGEPDHIPDSYPSNIRNQGDMAKLFQRSTKNTIMGMQKCSPGYIASQKICHVLQWLSTGSDLTVGNENGPLINYIIIKEYARINGVDPANIRQKISRGTLEAKKIGNEWLIDKDTPYKDARKKEL